MNEEKVLIVSVFLESRYEFSLPVSLSLSFTHKSAVGCLNVIFGVLLVLVNPSCLPVDIYLR